MNNKKQITTILWDVDGTLLDFPYSQRYAVTKCFQTVGREITEEMISRFAAINDAFWRRLELGEITREQLLPGRFEVFFEEFGIEGIDVEAFRKEYQEALGSVYSYLDDSLTICKSLQGRFRQYVITNGVASTQRKKLKLSGLDEVMEELFISGELGAEKPSRIFFDKCLERLEEKDKECILVVGDSVTSDIKGGIQAGLKTCWYHRKPEDCPGPAGLTAQAEEIRRRADYEINELHQIYDVLEVFP